MPRKRTIESTMAKPHADDEEPSGMQGNAAIAFDFS